MATHQVLAARLRRSVLAVLVFVLLVAIAAGLALTAPGPALAADGGPDCGGWDPSNEIHPCEGVMRVLVSDQPEACVADVCQFALGASFKLAVEILSFPDDEDDLLITGSHPIHLEIDPGYFGAQSFVDYGEDLVYKPTGAPADEILWPGCETATALRWQFTPQAVTHGCLTALFFPLTSTYIGSLVELSFTCSVHPSETLVRLLPLGDDSVLGVHVGPEGPPIDITAGSSGAGFVQEQGVQQVQIEPKVNDLTINCGQPAAVGGISVDSDLHALPLETTNPDGSPWGITTGVLALAILLPLGATAWYAKRRKAG